MSLCRCVSALLLVAATASAAEGDARVWETVSSPFRRRPTVEVPGHKRVAGAVPLRHARRSPVEVPLPGAEGFVLGKGGKGAAAGQLLAPAAGRQALEKAARTLEDAAREMESGDLEALSKELDATNRTLSSAVFSDKDQRRQAQEILGKTEALRLRIGFRQDFAKRKLRVTFIVWSPDGKSLAVVNQRIFREAEAIAPDLLVARIEPNEVVFSFHGEELSVGLQ